MARNRFGRCLPGRIEKQAFANIGRLSILEQALRGWKDICRQSTAREVSFSVTSRLARLAKPQPPGTRRVYC